MGDGRYYTYYQFFTIIFLTVLLIFQVVTFMMYYYKSEHCKRCRRLLSIDVLLMVSALLGFYSEVALDLGHAETAMDMVVLTMMTMVILTLIYFLGGSYGNKPRAMVLVLVLGLTFAYQVFCLTINPLMEATWAKAIQYLVLLGYTVGFVLVLEQMTPYRVSASIFKEVRSAMLDYVWIMGDRGEVVYVNEAVKQSLVFQETVAMVGDDVDQVFAIKPVHQVAFGESLLVVEGGPLYFTYSIKEIWKNEAVAGKIVTLRDVTQIVTDLDRLAKDQEEAMKLNEKLQAHKEVVYALEQEREINHLLEGYQQEHQDHMLALKSAIDDLLQGGDPIEVSTLEKLIQDGRSDLIEVRKTVSRYLEK